MQTVQHLMLYVERNLVGLPRDAASDDAGSGMRLCSPFIYLNLESLYATYHSETEQRHEKSSADLNSDSVSRRLYCHVRLLRRI